MYFTWFGRENKGAPELEVEPLLTPLVINTLLMGDTDHFAVLPPMAECIKRAHIWSRKHCGYRETRPQAPQRHVPRSPYPLPPGHRGRFVLSSLPEG